MNYFNKLLLVLALCLSVSTPSYAAGIDFNLLSATPVGSWQEREEVSTNHKGKQTVTVMRSSLLSKEQRDGQSYYWIEIAMDSYKVKKKGKRKKNGDRVIMKTLVSADLMKGDPGNVLTNLRGFGEEMIMQTGKEKPMRITGGGGMFAGMMKAMGTEVNYDFSALGSESVTVPAGEFTAQKIQGSGSTETKVVFKKIKVDSDSTAWMSKKVPFGIVKSEGTSTLNGKASTHKAELLAFGLSGAKSEITGEVQNMPNMGNIFGQ